MVDTSAPDADVEAVSRVATEYFQSWFAGDGERMRACLHPVLAKRTPEQPGTASLTLHEDPTQRLVADTASGEGTGFEPVQEVTVLDVFRDIADPKVGGELHVLVEQETAYIGAARVALQATR